MLQFGSNHVCIEDAHIFKHCREMTLFLFWIGAYCISCVVQQTSWSKGFVFSGKIWLQFFSCNEACLKYHTRSTTTPKYTLTQRLVLGMGLRARLELRYSLQVQLLFLDLKTMGTLTHVKVLLNWPEFLKPLPWVSIPFPVLEGESPA